MNLFSATEYSRIESGDQSLPNGIGESWKPRPRTEEERKKQGEAKPSETEMEVAERLGLHLSGKEPTAGDYVGLVWWPGHEGKTALCVKPKFKKMDYLAMYLECLQHPDVAPHMDKCFFFWPEKPLIEIERSKIPLDKAAAPFAALAFVRELHDMVRRNMRKNFIRQEENLTGRFKGRLLMSQHVRKNLLNGRPDRNYCQYGVISEDCRENQILLAALDRCARKLLQHDTVKKDANILRMIRVCRAALQGVTLRRHIHNRDFAGIRYTGTFIHYKRPHALARLILNSQELDPSVRTANETVKVVPFALCTSELFERYCEVQLRKHEPWAVWAGQENLGQYYKYRPDFLCAERQEGEGSSVKYWILDAKYYRSYQNGTGKITEDNVQQLLKYSQHIPIRKKLLELAKEKTDDGDKIKNMEPSLAILYPCLNRNEMKLEKEKEKEKECNEFLLPPGLIPVPVPSSESPSNTSG